VRPKSLIALIDGLDPSYIEASDMPNLRRLMAGGVGKTGSCVMPSVTNVNNASVVTGSFPAEHGIVSNFYFDPRSGEAVMMESGDFLLRPTMFEVAREAGLRSALVTAKDKIRTLLARGADIAVAAEAPDAEFAEAIGPNPGMYCAEVNYWVFRAARHLLRKPDIDVLYLSTTDYMMHTYGPADEASLAHMHELDSLLGGIVDDHPDLRLGLTADHGMNAKTRGIDIAKLLASAGIDAEAVPIIRDKHVVHHQNLGGACYVYLRQPESLEEAPATLQAEPGVEEVHGRTEAAQQFRLRADRIGDLFVLAAGDTAFGALPEIRSEIRIRSHGSLYEQAVPLLLYGAGQPAGRFEYNLDLTRLLIAPV
jgi:phosphonoacetate hydrolase